MILISFFICSTCSINKNAPFLEIIPGEWDILQSNPKYSKNSFSPYSAEFHLDPITSSIYGSIWANVNSSNAMIDLEDVEIAQLEIQFQTPVSGTIYNLQPSKKLMTQFEFKPIGFGASLMTRGKINDEYAFQLTITNGTIFQIFIMSSKSSEVSEFYAFLTKAPSSSSGMSLLKIAIFVCIFLIALQIILWLLLKYCKARIENKVTQQQENTIIDLDKYSDYLKEQMKAKSD